MNTMMNISAISYDLDRSFDGTLPDVLVNLVTAFHPTVALWSDDSPFSTAMRNCLLALTSVLQFNPILDLRSFPSAVVFLIFRNLSAVTAPEFRILPHPKTRVVLLTNDERVGTSKNIESYEGSFESLTKFRRTKFVWFNVNEEARQFTIYSTLKSTKMELVEISPRDAVRQLMEPARLINIPNFQGEEIVVTLVNNTVYSKITPWAKRNGKGWKIGGFHVLYLEMVCNLMNLSIEYRKGDCYGRFENGTFTPGIYKDLIERKMDASAVGGFLRPEAIGLVENSIPWNMACVRYLVPRPKLLNSSSRVFVNVFSRSLWLAIAVFVLVSSCVAALAARVSDCPSHKCYRNIPTGVMKMLFHLLQLQHPARAEYRNSLVPLLVAWGWMGFILTAMYCSELAATFTIPFFAEKIQTESQFIERGFTWGSQLPLDRILYFDMSDPATKRWVTEFNNDQETEEDRERKMRNGNYVVVGLSYGKVFFFREPNTPPSDITDGYEVADECTLKKHVGILFSLGSPYLEGVNLITRRLISGGILQKFEYNEMMKYSGVPPNVFTLSKDMKNVAGFTQLPISVFYGPIYLLMCGYLVSATVLILHEHTYKNFYHFYRQHY